MVVFDVSVAMPRFWGGGAAPSRFHVLVSFMKAPGLGVSPSLIFVNGNRGFIFGFLLFSPKVRALGGAAFWALHLWVPRLGRRALEYCLGGG